MAKKFIRRRTKEVVINAFGLDEHDTGRYDDLSEYLQDDVRVKRLKSMLKKEFGDGNAPKKSKLRICEDIDDIANEVEEIYDPNKDPRNGK